MNRAQTSSLTRLHVELPDDGVTAGVELYTDAAPDVTKLLYAALSTPLETTTSHACFDGHQVFCFLPEFDREPPLQNRTMRPHVGEVMLFFAREHEFAALSERRLSGGRFPMFELAFMYGPVDLRYLWEDGLQGSLVGRIDQNLEAFAAVCLRTLTTGATRLRICQAPAGTGPALAL